MMNLVVNAIDASAGVASPKRQIGLRTARAGDFADIGVCDNGPVRLPLSQAGRALG